MEVNETMSKQITETAYLTTENTKRYSKNCAKARAAWARHRPFPC